MSRTQKLKGLSAASLRLKTFNDNPYIKYYGKDENHVTKLLTESYCSHVPGTQIIDGGVLYMVFELK